MKKDILIFNQNMVMGGVEKVMLNILENLNREKFNIKVVLVEKYGELIEKLPKDLEIIYLLDKNYSRNRSGIFKIIGYLKELVIINKKLKKIIKKNHILLNMNIRNMRINLSFLKYKNKKIGWIHTTIIVDKVYNPFIKKLKELIFSQYTIIFNVAKQGKKDFEFIFPKLKEKSKLLYNSFDINSIVKKSLVPLELFNNKNLKYILSVGRLNNEHKGFNILIEAMKKLKDEKINLNLIIIGDGIDKENLKNQIKKLNLEKEITILGYDINPYKWMRNAEIFILPSNYEGLPTVLIEALSCEVPIISTNCICGPNEILEDGKYGILIPVGNSEMLKEKIKYLFFNEKLKKIYKQESLKRAYYFSNERILKQLEDNIIKL